MDEFNNDKNNVSNVLLPHLYMITGFNLSESGLFLDKLEKHFKEGIKLVQLRVKELSAEEYRKLAICAIQIEKKYQAILLLNSAIQMVSELNASGIHLTSELLMQLQERPLTQDKFISASCHNEKELLKAAAIGVNFVTLSPVLHTKSHPEVRPLGWSAFRALCEKANVPVYALGGLSENDLPMAVEHGAYGIAAISSLWERTYPALDVTISNIPYKYGKKTFL